MQILDRDGDDLTIKRIGTSPTATDGRADIDGDDGRTSAANGASQIISGEANVGAVLPVHTHNNKVPRMEALFADSSIPFPRDVLIVPGSFNPPHQGHVGLATAAVSALQRLRQQNLEEANQNNDTNAINSRPYSRYSSLASNVSSSSSSSAILKSMWSTVDQYVDEQYEPTVFFEMSVTNADKPPLDPVEVERRVNLFTTLPSADMPKDRAVILTNAPLFSQKAEILDNLIPGDSFDTDNSQSRGNNRKMSFVLGTDTMVRIINPKYYDSSREKMLAALVDMKEKGVHFIVGGRLEQGTDEDRYVLVYHCYINTKLFPHVNLVRG